jgi:hypothetical protein
MSGHHGNMITAASDVICFGKAGRCKELLDRVAILVELKSQNVSD